MVRPFLIVAMSGLLLAASPAQPNGMPSLPNRAAMEARAAAIQKRDTLKAEQIDALARNIHSLKDSRRLIVLVEKQFPHSLKRREIPRRIRRRIVLAEYASVSSPAGLIPDERIADAWNWFMGQIGAPQQERVNARVIYALRDAHYTGARMMWRRNLREIWTIPGIYAVGADGKVDRRGATALEAIDMIYQMSSSPHNLKSARYWAQPGHLFSDAMEREAKHPPKHPHPTVAWGFAEGPNYNKVQVAARRYVREHGAAQYKQLLESFADRVFPAQPAG